ncbi:condensation domain-containing protein [Collimonas pratensis]|uniref:Condensation domain protein n=1 Tax=Collimonas pratensis TaxID=279113 RepID=A0ABM5Z958_9BURK|nr:condensation domain-containing protein [Collimonas pratensis]AMP15610.1 condensation domain protein [Collimonas pratensis]
MEIVVHPAAASALTVNQTAVWLKVKCATPGDNFNVAEAVDIVGEIDLAQFLAAMQKVADESESARLRLLDSEDGPRQIVEQHFGGELPYLDFSRDRDPEAAAEAWMRADYSRAIDLIRGRPWLSALLRTSRDRYIWYRRSHRILPDGSEHGRMARHLAAAYSALDRHHPLPAAAPSPSIAQLLQDENAYRESEHYIADRNYWTGRLHDAPAPLSLSLQRHFNGDALLRQTACFPAAGVQALQSIAHKLDISLPQLLIAVTVAFLYRASGVTDMLIGVAAGTADALPLRLALNAELSFEELMRDIGRQMRNIALHQSYPCEELRHDLRKLSGQRELFSTVIKAESNHCDLRFGSHPARLRQLCDGSAEDLAITLYERGAGRDLEIIFDANPAIHSAQMLAEHQRRLLTFLAAATHSPAQKINQLELADATGRKHLPASAEDADHPIADSRLATLIEQQLARKEPAIALRFEGESSPSRAAEDSRS